MKNNFILFFACLSLGSQALAGTIIGQIQTPSTGRGIANGTLTFTLSQAAVVSGAATLAGNGACWTDNLGNVVGLPGDAAVTAPVLSSNLGSGSLPAGTYFVRYTWANATGESQPSAERSLVLGSSGMLIVQAPVNVPALATSMKVYVGTTSGGETLQGSITVTGGVIGGNYSQSAALVGGAALPSGNTSACQIRFNDELQPSFTAYSVAFTNVNGAGIAGFPQKWYLSGGSNGTVNVSNGTPLYAGVVQYPQAIVSNPAANGTQSINGGLNLNGFSLTAGAMTGCTTNGVLRATCYPGSDIGAQVNAAEASSDCPATGCHILIPITATGVYAQTTQIVMNKTIFLECDGTSSQANVTNHQTVTLNWTGGSTQQILISGSAATGWKIKGCALNNSGAASWGLDIDNAAGEAILQEFAIVEPSLTYSGGGIRVGNTSGVVALHFKDVNVRAAGPVGINLVNVNAHFVGEKVRSSFNALNEWLLGTPTTDVLSFSCYGCIVESSSGVNGYEIIRAQGARWIGGYCEGGGNANNYCWDIPNTAARAAGIEVVGQFISCVRAPCSNAAIHSNFGSAAISMRDNFLSGFSSGNKFIQNDTIVGGELSGNDSDATGFLEASSFVNLITHGNRIAGSLQPSRIPVIAGNSTSFTNNADAINLVMNDSGATATQIGEFVLRDRGTSKWALVKDASNVFSVLDQTTGKNILMATTSSTTQINSQGANAVQINVASGSGTGGLTVGDGNGLGKFFINSAGHINQSNSGVFAGTCAMSASTSCTVTIGAAYNSTPGCVATVQGTTAIAGACSISGITATVTAASANSATWAAMLFGNPN
jgi:hypothetical protein